MNIISIEAAPELLEARDCRRADEFIAELGTGSPGEFAGLIARLVSSMIVTLACRDGCDPQVAVGRALAVADMAIKAYERRMLQ